MRLSGSPCYYLVSAFPVAQWETFWVSTSMTLGGCVSQDMYLGLHDLLR